MIGVVFELRSAGYDVSLQGDEIALDFTGDDDPDSAVVRPLIEEMKANKADLIHSLKREALCAANIGLAISRARDWEDLSVIWPHMDIVFNMGNLTAQEHDSLVAQVKARSREVPEDKPAEEVSCPNKT
jgi:hypothetical protein